MEKSKDDLKKLFKVIVFAVITYWVINNFNVIGDFIGNILSMASPFIWGAALAFILNIPMEAIEKRLVKPKRKNKKKRAVNSKIIRVFSLILSIVFIGFMLFLIVKLVVPELVNVVKLVIEKIPYYIDEITQFIESDEESGKSIKEFLAGINFEPESVKKELLTFASGLLTSSISIVGNFVNVVVNAVIAVVFALYLLVSKETLKEQFKRLFKAYLPEKRYDGIMNVLKIAKNTFANFFTVQCFDAILLGILCIIGMLVFKIPYAVPVGVLVGVTALIPLVGGFIGVIIGSFLIISVAPLKVLTFIVFVVILQQVEANLIYPKIVGDSVGLPGIWVLVAVSLGGKLFGVIGMLIGVPLASVVYTIIRNDVYKRLKVKK